MKMPQSADFKLADFRSDEKIIAVIRRHWFVLFREVAGLILVFFVPFFLVPVVWSMVADGGLAVDISKGVGFFLTSLWALIIWQLIFARWTDYYYDMWIITNIRIIDIDQQGFFKRDVATLVSLNHIEDIKTQLKGIIGNLLGFGELQVQTAAAQREFVMEDIANPDRVEKVISRLRQELPRLEELTRNHA